MNPTVTNDAVKVYVDLRQKERRYFWVRTKKHIVLDLIKTALASFAGAAFFPLGIIFFFYFHQSKSKILAYIILGVTLATSNLVIFFMQLYHMILESIEFSQMYL